MPKQQKPKLPKISVCIPVYNAECWLAESIQSIVDQTFKDWEIVLIDDYSTDSSRKIVDFFLNKFREDGIWERIKYHRNEDYNIHVQQKKPALRRPQGLPDYISGIASTRNHAVAYSEGEIIVVQDADDISHKERLQKTWDYFKRHDKVDLIYGSCQYIDPFSKPFHLVQSEPFDFELLKTNNYIQHPTVAYRKKAFEDVGGYRPECTVIDDWFLYMDFFKKGKKFGKLDDVLSFYRVLPDSVSRSPEKAKLVEEMKKKFMEEAGELCVKS